MPFHLNVHAGLGGLGETEAGVQLVGGGVGDRYREEDGTVGFRLELAEKLGADATALGGGGKADVDEEDFSLGMVDPPTADRLAVFFDYFVACVGVVGLVSDVFGQILHLN